ncbi:MAG: hypothetical protein GY830_07185 [Bacteroidetes bacterium]|nr:hypothetical protein [Bacteroidota bacterium]
MKFIYSIWIGGIIIAIYSSLGGIRSVAMTDVFQFCALLLVILIIAFIILIKIKGFSNFYNKINNIDPKKFKILTHSKFNYYLVISLVRYLLPTTILSPPFIQRILMMHNKTQIRNIFIINSLVIVIIKSLITLIGLGAFILYPAINFKLIFPSIINNMFSPILQGFLFIGLLAAVMSTADSFLNSAGLLFVHDILEPLFRSNKINFNNLTYIRTITFIIGLISVFIAKLEINVYLMIYFACCLMSTTTIPFIFGVVGLKPSKNSFFLAIIFSLITMLILLYFSIDKNLIILISIFVNALVFFIVNYIDNKRFIFLERKIRSETIWNPKWNN